MVRRAHPTTLSFLCGLGAFAGDIPILLVAASMDRRSVLLLTQEAWNEISRHAQETFPEECCGVVLSAGGLDYIYRLKNIQNKLHALDPLTYPRTAAIAYAMDPLEL